MESFVWTNIGCPSIGSAAVKVIEGAGNEKPVEWRISTALAGAEPGTCLGVFCVFFGDAKLGSEVIPGCLQSPCLDHTDLLIHAILLASQVGQKARDSVVAGGGIIVEVNQWPSGEATYLVLQLSHKDWVKGAPTGHGPIAGRVHQVMVTDVVKELSPFDAEQQVEVPLIQVDDPESVDLWLTRILFEHGVDNAVPPVVGVSKLESIIQQCHMPCNDFVAQLLNASNWAHSVLGSMPCLAT